MIFFKDIGVYRVTVSFAGYPNEKQFLAEGLTPGVIDAVKKIFEAQTGCKRYAVELFNSKIDPVQALNAFFKLMYNENQFSTYYRYVEIPPKGWVICNNLGEKVHYLYAETWTPVIKQQYQKAIRPSIESETGGVFL